MNQEALGTFERSVRKDKLSFYILKPKLFIFLSMIVFYKFSCIKKEVLSQSFLQWKAVVSSARTLLLCSLQVQNRLALIVASGSVISLGSSFKPLKATWNYNLGTVSCTGSILWSLPLLPVLQERKNSCVPLSLPPWCFMLKSMDQVTKDPLKLWVKKIIVHLQQFFQIFSSVLSKKIVK